LHNVVVVVVADSALNFGPFGSQRLHGIVGLPAIRALGSMAVSARGVVRIHSDSPKVHQSAPNIFFDWLTPIVEVRHAGRAVPMKLDTGGDTTYLYSSPLVRGICGLPMRSNGRRRLGSRSKRALHLLVTDVKAK
jgi:hypothetical protein